MNNSTHDFRPIAEVVLQALENYIADSQAGKGKALTQLPVQTLVKELALEQWIRKGGMTPETIAPFVKTYLKNTQRLHHPHYIGHQVAVPHIASGMADLIHGTINSTSAIYEMNPAGTAIEMVLINWMLDKVGWFKGESWGDCQRAVGSGGGILTHGGSMANLTALSAARAAIAPNAWTDGTPSDLVVLGSKVAHYSIARTISVMGMGKKAFVPVAVNDLEVLRVDDLLPTYKRAKAEGKRIMAVVANACATSTGLYDPLDEIGDFCLENSLWLHVDGAHGASVLLSPKERYLVRGIEKATSITWDAHKMLRSSTLCAAILFRDYKTLGTTFQQKGSYLFHDKEELGLDLIGYTFECTKSAIGDKLFWALAAEGEQGITHFIETVHDNARKFYHIIHQHPNFDCLCLPEANIVCFRYLPIGSENANQLALRNEVVKRGNFYITSSEINGLRYLRLSVMNPLTTSQHIEALLVEIEQAAKALFD